jgi:A/G-specific adenine glycosylase
VHRNRVSKEKARARGAPRGVLGVVEELLGLSPAALTSLRRAVPALHRWYRDRARDLPWRRTRDPYAVWVSEIMLQQTQVASVVPYFERWMKAFPTVQALAIAGQTDVLRLWEGLGYYSRALNLHRAAQQVLAEHGGTVPSDPHRLGALPGIGRYTAAAVLSIAFDEDLAVLDGNVRRVLSRLVGLSKDVRRAPFPAALQALAAGLLPPGTAALHNQAMMELGARVCTPRVPRCGVCPLRRRCRACLQGDPESCPARVTRAALPHHRVAVGIVFRDGLCFIDRRPYGALLGGLWEFPGGKMNPGESPQQAVVRELDEEFALRVTVEQALPVVRHAYSHFRVTLYPQVCAFVGMRSRAGEGRVWQWVDPADLPDFPMPRASRKVIEELVTLSGPTDRVT